MEWLQPKRRGAEWKQGWTSRTLASASMPPLPLLTIFGVVMALLWLSGYNGYKAQMQHNAINLQLFVILLPILLILFLVSSSDMGSKFSFRLPQPRTRNEAIRHGGGGGASPWGVAMVVGLVLVMVSYQSSFHSKWFGP